MARKAPMGLRFPEETKVCLRHAANRLGITVAEYIRRSVDKALERDRLGHLPISPRASAALLNLETKVPEGTDLLEYLLDNQDP
jgi:hypothetical protein